MSLSLSFGKHFETLPTLPISQIEPLFIPLDIAVFVLVIVQTRLIKITGMNAPSILDTVSRDARIYFALIATSHLVSVLMFGLARVGVFAPVPEFNAY